MSKVIRYESWPSKMAVSCLNSIKISGKLSGPFFKKSSKYIIILGLTSTVKFVKFHIIAGFKKNKAIR